MSMPGNISVSGRNKLLYAHESLVTKGFQDQMNGLIEMA